MFRLIVIVIPVAVTIYALIDAMTAPKRDVRGMPKWLWILLILVLWIGGAVMWFFLGRPKRGVKGFTGWDGTTTDARPQGPDDDPDFLSNISKPKPKSDSPE